MASPASRHVSGDSGKTRTLSILPAQYVRSPRTQERGVCALGDRFKDSECLAYIRISQYANIIQGTASTDERKRCPQLFSRDVRIAKSCDKLLSVGSAEPLERPV